MAELSRRDRSVNNRFQIFHQIAGTVPGYEGDIDKLLRSGLGRGSVTYGLRVKDSGSMAYQINESMLEQYAQRLGKTRRTPPYRSGQPA
jgi:uncharacterized protein YicC (UPF0701 family)